MPSLLTIFRKASKEPLKTPHSLVPAAEQTGPPGIGPAAALAPADEGRQPHDKLLAWMPKSGGATLPGVGYLPPSCVVVWLELGFARRCFLTMPGEVGVQCWRVWCC